MNAQAASPEILELLKEIRKKAVIGFVGGSNLVKITEQLGNSGQKELRDFTWTCHLTAYSWFQLSMISTSGLQRTAW
jgi:phosphomannomutase